jgi:hypothetical protein
MKKCTLILISIVWLTNMVIAQDTIAVFKRANSFLLGLSPATRPVFVDTYNNNYIFQLGGSARIGYFPISRLAIIAEYSKYALISNVIDKQDAFTMRFAGRYYWRGTRSGVYTDLGYMVSDSRVFKGDSTNTKKFPSHYLALAGGFSIKINKNLYFDLSQHATISLNGSNTVSSFGTRIGFDYIFNNKYKDIPKRKRVKTKEEEGSDRKFQIATGAFIFPFPEDSGFGERYNEYLWTSKFGYYVTQHFTVGLISGLILGQPKVQDNRFFYFAGPYLNYKIFSKEKVSVYLETGYNYSNHTISEVGLPRNSPVQYLNLGGGLNYRFNSDVYLDAGVVLQSCIGGGQKCEGDASIFRLGVEFVIR